MFTKQLVLFPGYLKSLHFRKILWFYYFVVIYSLAWSSTSPLRTFFGCCFFLSLYPKFGGYSSWRQGRWEIIFSLRDIFKNSISLIIKKDKVFPWSKQVERGNEHDFVAHTCVSKVKHEREKYTDEEKERGIQQCLDLLWNR